MKFEELKVGMKDEVSKTITKTNEFYITGLHLTQIKPT